MHASSHYSSGVKLTNADDDFYALIIRIESAVGNYVSLSSAPKVLLAACQNPFRHGDGVLDNLIEFVATPMIAAKLLAYLEYLHIDASLSGESGPVNSNLTRDVVTVTATDGGCYYYDNTRLTGCPRESSAPRSLERQQASESFTMAIVTESYEKKSSFLRIELELNGGLTDMVERYNESWHRSLLRSVPIAIGAAFVAVCGVMLIWGSVRGLCAWRVIAVFLAARVKHQIPQTRDPVNYDDGDDAFCCFSWSPGKPLSGIGASKRKSNLGGREYYRRMRAMNAMHASQSTV